jgi:hypothetical protein
MRIKVSGIEGISDLADDLEQSPRTARLRGDALVMKHAEIGNSIAQGIARKAAGKHGKNYYKRLSAERTGTWQAEFGPEGPPKTDYVGVSGTAGAMRDLEKAAERVAPRFARDAGKLLDSLFWPGSG